MSQSADVSILREGELRALVDLDGDGLDAVREALRALSAGDAVQPPVMRIDVPEHHGEVDVKGAYVRGLDSFAVKLSSGFFDNPQRGLPTGSGLMVLLDATPATEPIVQAAWLHPGQHLTAMGSDAERKQELEPAVLRRADVLVCDRRSQGLAIGELRSAHEAGVDVGEERVAELGEVLAGTRPGRTSDDQITVCDLTGTGVQDTAIARLAAARAAAAG